MRNIIFIMTLILCANLCSAQTQAEMNEQEHAKYVKADRKLNSIYQQILKDYKDDAEFIKNLKASQKLWVLFRDAEMKMKYPDRELGQYGSVQPMCWSIYLTQLTEERIAILQQWIDGVEEGDVCAGSAKIRTH